MDFTDPLKTFALSLGASLVGVADLSNYQSDELNINKNLFKEYPFAVSVAVKLDDYILDNITVAPTPDYARLYKEINAKLDDISLNIENWVIEKGFKAKSILASQTVDQKKLLGFISHKAIGRLAGLGWQGKSLLLINEKIGPRFRLTSVLTNINLTADEPVKNRCGKCKECTNACPAQAIKNVNTQSFYKDRNEAVDLNRCYSKLLQFKALEDVGVTICGFCIKACPFGKK